jgi:hypothetical protein
MIYGDLIGYTPAAMLYRFSGNLMNLNIGILGIDETTLSKQLLLSEISEWLDSSLTSLTQAFTLEMQ